ncbi:MAG: hypothetical protein GC178_02580 [Flavobacteriales bacterium]|nr:hypothetical protein [Flavobacteriales bacterium]
MKLPLILISWLIALQTWAPIGLWVLKKLNATLEERPVHNFILATIVGAAVNATILGLLSLWMPITINFSMVLMFICILILSRTFKKAISTMFQELKTWSVFGWGALIGLIGIAVVFTAMPSLNNDSGLYYIQFMKWINSYPVVPGLANLHDRLGFNSHWHLLSAAFDLNGIDPTGSNDLNAFLFILIGLGCIASAERLRHRSDLFDAIWALFPLPFFLLLRFLTSTAPDLPSTLIPLTYLSLVATQREKASLPLLALLIVFAATIKVLSVLHVIAIIPLAWMELKKQRWNTIGLAATLAVVVALPWVLRNVMQTGYLVFPMESLDLFSFDWKVPNELAANARKMVDVHARFGNYDLANYGRPMNDWLPFWFGVQSKTVLGLMAFVFAGSFLLVVADMFMIDRHRGTNRVAFNLFLALTVLISFAFWWQSGPNPRFIYGIVFFFLAYSLAVLATQLRVGKWLRFLPLAALLPMLAIGRTILKEEPPTRPTEFATMPNVDATVYYPTTTDKCWDHALPCANRNRTDLELRGAELKDGFRNTETEK